MKCSRCGAPLEEGKLFCPVCGQEVQLVPDYETMETVLYRQREEQARRESQRAARQEAARQEQLRLRKIRKKRISLAVSVAAVGLLALFLVWLLMLQRRHNSYPYQIGRAREHFIQGEYEAAQGYLERALELTTDQREAYLLELQILRKGKKGERLEQLFDSLREEYPDEPSFYKEHISYLLSEDRAKEVKELLDGCSESVRRACADYITAAPEFSLAEGEYQQLLSVTLSGKPGDIIYYTLDGRDPDETSHTYMSPISLNEGSTMIKAVACNKYGIPSEIISQTYQVRLEAPDPPAIYPKSGEYTSATDTNLYVVVPEGCTAHYAFDRKAGREDAVYEGPVPMLKGEHSFYAILVDKNGKVSSQGSIVYKLTET